MACESCQKASWNGGDCTGLVTMEFGAPVLLDRHSVAVAIGLEMIQPEPGACVSFTEMPVESPLAPENNN